MNRQPLFAQLVGNTRRQLLQLAWKNKARAKTSPPPLKAARSTTVTESSSSPCMPIAARPAPGQDFFFLRNPAAQHVDAARRIGKKAAETEGQWTKSLAETHTDRRMAGRRVWVWIKKGRRGVGSTMKLWLISKWVGPAAAIYIYIVANWLAGYAFTGLWLLPFQSLFFLFAIKSVNRKSKLSAWTEEPCSRPFEAGK